MKMGSNMQTGFLAMAFGIWVVVVSPSVFGNESQTNHPKGESRRHPKEVFRDEVLKREQIRANSKWRSEDPQGFEKAKMKLLDPTLPKEAAPVPNLTKGEPLPKEAVPVPNLTKGERTQLRELRNDDGSHSETMNRLRRGHKDWKGPHGRSQEDFQEAKDRRIKKLMTKPGKPE